MKPATSVVCKYGIETYFTTFYFHNVIWTVCSLYFDRDGKTADLFLAIFRLFDGVSVSLSKIQLGHFHHSIKYTNLTIVNALWSDQLLSQFINIYHCTWLGQLIIKKNKEKRTKEL